MKLVAAARPPVRVVPRTETVGRLPVPSPPLGLKRILPRPAPGAQGVTAQPDRIRQRHFEANRLATVVDGVVLERRGGLEGDHDVAHDREAHPPGDHLPIRHPVPPLLQTVLEIGVDADNPVRQGVEPARLGRVRPSRALFRPDPERGSDVAEGEPDHLRGRRVDPHLAGNQGRTRPAGGDLDPHQAERTAPGRGHRQVAGQCVAIPLGSGLGERVQRARRGEIVAEDPHRVVHLPRDEPWAVPHARKLNGAVPGPESAADHVHPEVVRLLPLHPRHLLLDGRRGHLGPEPPSHGDGEPVTNRRLVVADRGVAQPAAGRGALDQLLDGLTGKR